MKIKDTVKVINGIYKKKKGIVKFINGNDITVLFHNYLEIIIDINDLKIINSKFKIGNNVRLIKDAPTYHSHSIGSEGIITHVDDVDKTANVKFKHKIRTSWTPQKSLKLI